MANPSFDIVLVPDFSGPQAPTFAARSLLFLAAWLEHAGETRSFPLHLACIGEPPDRVRSLAEMSGAILSLHKPVQLEPSGMANKLRGFEAPLQTGHLLLLDVDTIILGDLSGLADLGDFLSAAPAIAYRVPEEYWQRIYSALELHLPPEWWIACLLDEMANHPRGTYHLPGSGCLCRPMPPYYNSGVLWAPQSSGLERLWAEDILRIPALFTSGDPSWHTVGECDQAGLATAITRLRKRGVNFQRLPDAWHVTQVHLFNNWLPLRQVRIFHAIKLFHSMNYPLTAQAMLAGLNQYRARLVRNYLISWRA